MAAPLLFRRPSPVAPPAGQAGFDPSHVASKGTSLIPFSAVASGSGFVCLSPNPGLPQNSGSSATIGLDGAIGRAAAYSGTSVTTFTSLNIPNAPWTKGTLAAVFRSGSTAAGFKCLVQQLEGNSALFADWSSTGTLSLAQPNGGTATNSGLTVAANTPYFAAASYNGTNVNFVLVNLATGKVQTNTGQAPPTWNATQAAVIDIGNDSNGNTPLDGKVATVAVINNYLSIADLLQWAQDPWSFWYPYVFSLDNFIVGTTSTAAALAPAIWFDRQLVSGEWFDPDLKIGSWFDSQFPTAASTTAALLARAGLMLFGKAAPPSGKTSISSAAAIKVATKSTVLSQANLAATNALKTRAAASVAGTTNLAAKAAVQAAQRSSLSGKTPLTSLAKLASRTASNLAGSVSLLAKAGVAVRAAASMAKTAQLAALGKMAVRAAASSLTGTAALSSAAKIAARTASSQTGKVALATAAKILTATRGGFSLGTIAIQSATRFALRATGVVIQTAQLRSIAKISARAAATSPTGKAAMAAAVAAKLRTASALFLPTALSGKTSLAVRAIAAPQALANLSGKLAAQLKTKAQASAATLLAARLQIAVSARSSVTWNLALVATSRFAAAAKSGLIAVAPIVSLAVATSFRVLVRAALVAFGRSPRQVNARLESRSVKATESRQVNATVEMRTASPPTEVRQVNAPAEKRSVDVPPRT